MFGLYLGTLSNITMCPSRHLLNFYLLCVFVELSTGNSSMAMNAILFKFIVRSFSIISHNLRASIYVWHLDKFPHVLYCCIAHAMHLSVRCSSNKYLNLSASGFSIMAYAALAYDFSFHLLINLTRIAQLFILFSTPKIIVFPFDYS